MKRMSAMLLLLTLVLTLFAPTGSAGGATYLQVYFDQESYHPGETARVVVAAHGFPAGLASATVELEYDTTVFGQPIIPEDLLYGGILDGATVLPPIHRPGSISINLSRHNGTLADSGTGGMLFYLRFPVLQEAPDTIAARIGFGPVTGLDDDGILLLDSEDNEIYTAGNQDGHADIWLGGDITGSIALRHRVSGDLSGIKVAVQGDEATYATTDTTGTFTLSDLTPGQHNLLLSKPGYLTTAVNNVPVVRGGVTDISCYLANLIPGNIRDVAGLNTDTIFLEDLAALARGIGSSSGSGVTQFQTEWNPAADLDGNGSVGGSDLALMADYWGLSGASGNGKPAPGTVIDQPGCYSVTFTVVDGSSQPISGATVSIAGPQNMNGRGADAAGGNVITAGPLGGGAYTYTVTAPGYVNYSGSFNLSADSSQTVVMAPSTFSLQLTVVDGSAQPISGATISITGPQNFENLTADQAQGNVFTIPEVLAGFYNYQVTAPAYQNYSGSVNVSANTTQTVQMVAVPRYDISFRAYDSTNNNSDIANPSITLTGAETYGPVAASDGLTISINQVLAGTYNYTLTAFDYVTVTDTINIGASGNVSMFMTPMKYTLTVTTVAAGTTTPVVNPVIVISGVTPPGGWAADSWNGNVINMGGALRSGTYDYTVTTSDNTWTASGQVTISAANKSITVEMSPAAQ